MKSDQERRSWAQEVRALLPGISLERLIEQDGVAWVRRGGASIACCPFHGERTPSMHIYPDGHYHCFGCSAHGDAATYLRERRRLDPAQVLEVLRRESGQPCSDGRPPTAKRDGRRKHQVVMPVPAVGGRVEPSFAIHGLGRPSKIFKYFSSSCDLLMIVARYDYEREGKMKKSIRTWCWARAESDGSESWQCTRPSQHLPLYGLDRLAKNPAATVLLVEGEKSADAAYDIPGFVGVSWCGGAANLDHEDRHDWSPLAGRNLVIWPDHDLPGVMAAFYAWKYLMKPDCRIIDARAANVPDGHDVADIDAAEREKFLTAHQRSNPARVLRDLIRHHLPKDDA